MQVSDPNYPGFKLPAVINPPDSLCFTVKVPNDPAHVAAFLGALYELTQWISWQRDAGKHGKDAAAVWRDIWFNLRSQACEIKPSALTGAEIQDFMPLRVDCDCNVWVTCCDGTEKQILTSAQVQALLIGQPAQGQPQPAPGGCQTFTAKLRAGQQLLIPIPVSTGDTIEVTSAVGAGNDPDAGPVWHCPNGSIFFAGACAGAGVLIGTDPLPALAHMRLIYEVNGTFYDAMAGPLTLPGGVSLIQPLLQVNDQTIINDAGEYTVTVKVCNNQVGTFTHHWDFRLNSYGFAPYVAGGSASVWVPGVGFRTITTAVAASNEQIIGLGNTHALTGLAMRVIGSRTAISPVGDGLHTFDATPPFGWASIENHGISLAAGAIDSGNVAFASTGFGVQAALSASATIGENAIITDLYVSANGADPF